MRLETLDALLRRKRFATKRKGCDKKHLSRKLCRKRVSVAEWGGDGLQNHLGQFDSGPTLQKKFDIQRIF